MGGFLREKILFGISFLPQKAVLVKLLSAVKIFFFGEKIFPIHKNFWQFPKTIF